MCSRRQHQDFDLSDLLPKSFTNVYLGTLQYTFYEELRLRYAPEPSAPASLMCGCSSSPVLQACEGAHARTQHVLNTCCLPSYVRTRVRANAGAPHACMCVLLPLPTLQLLPALLRHIGPGVTQEPRQPGTPKTFKTSKRTTSYI